MKLSLPLFSAIFCLISFAPLTGSPIVGQLTLSPEAISEIQAKIAPSIDSKSSWINQFSTFQYLSIFLVQLNEQSIEPVVLIKGSNFNSSTLPTWLNTLEYTSFEGWHVGAVKGINIPESLLAQTLIPQALVRTPAPIYALVYPQKVVSTLYADSAFKEKSSKLFIGSMLDELADIDRLELRATPNPWAFRCVLIIKARAESPLHDFFSQRLPASLPDQHERIPVSNATAFGYFSYNPASVRQYLAHLQERFATSLPPFSQQIGQIGSHSDCAKGYSAFVQMPAESIARFFHQGDWNKSNAVDFMRACYGVTHQISDTQQLDIAQAFLVGEDPVWRITPAESKFEDKDKEKSKEDSKSSWQTATSPKLLFSLSGGNLAQGATPEALTSFMQDLEPPAIDKNTLARGFGHLPTICFQAKYKSSSLLPNFTGPADSKNLTNKSLYAAASLGAGQLAITVDLPYELAPALINWAKP